jgi:DNA-binding HxlR family transcriptional regulator
MRAGTQLLIMAANPVKRRILREMVERPLCAGPGCEYRVTTGGKEALFIGFVVERWLQSAPKKSLPFESRAAEQAVAALADAWSSTVMHALAREPLTLNALLKVTEVSDRRALGRCLAAMQHAGQVEERSNGDGEIIYAMTDWLRAGIAPLIASARLERRNPTEDMAPIDALDVEAGFRCSLSLLPMPRELSGVCRLGINLDDDGNGCLTGVTATVEQGRVVSCEAGFDSEANAWAAGSAIDWLDTVIEPDTKRVRTGGDAWLTAALVDALHKALFGIPVA